MAIMDMDKYGSMDVCMDKYGEVVTQFRVEIEIFINLTCILKYTN